MTHRNPRLAARIAGGGTGRGLTTARTMHERDFAGPLTGRNPNTIAPARRALQTVVRLRVSAVVPAPIETPAFGKLGLPQEVVKGFADTFAAHVPIMDS